MSKLPTIKEVADVIKYCIKPNIRDEYKEDGDSLPSICLTVGFSPDSGRWDWQSGDNSFSGGAYLHRYWGVRQVYRRSNSRQLAKEIIDEIASQID